MAGAYQFDPTNSNPAQKVQGSFFEDSQATTPQGRAAEIFNRLFSYEPPKPKYDENRPEELRRRMRLNTIGSGMKLLGDVLTMKKGGNVVQRQPDQTNDQLANYMYDYTDRLNSMENDWNMRNYHANIQKGVMMLDQENRNEAREFRDKSFDTAQENRKEDIAYRDKAYEEQVAARDRAEKRADEQFAYQKQAPYIQHELQKDLYQTRMEGEMAKYAAKAQYNADKKEFSLYTTDGGFIANVNDGQMAKLTSIILNDQAIGEKAKGDIQLMKAKLGDGFTPLVQRQILASYVEHVPAAMQFLKGDVKTETPAQDLSTVFRPQYNGPVPASEPTATINPQVTAPAAKQRESIDYSKIAF